MEVAEVDISWNKEQLRYGCGGIEPETNAEYDRQQLMHATEITVHLILQYSKAAD